MTDKPDKFLVPSDCPELVRRVRARTPARLLVGRAGAAYRTSTQMELRLAHAAARDAVRAELDLEANLGADFVKRWELVEVSTQAGSRQEYLLRPDLGRHFNDTSRAELLRSCSQNNTLHIAIGDGLSIRAIATQLPSLLPLLDQGARVRGWSVGRMFVVRHCRVGILNEIGELLLPEVAVLLIGERPGLATAESMSAYMAYRPKVTHTDANRNLVSNIHPKGCRSEDAAVRILNLAERMMKLGTSGYQLREQLPLESPGVGPSH